VRESQTGEGAAADAFFGSTDVVLGFFPGSDKKRVETKQWCGPVFFFLPLSLPSLSRTVGYEAPTMSKLQTETLSKAIAGLLAGRVDKAGNKKKRRFLETVELQIGLKSYDPQKDKRFAGAVKLPYVARPKYVKSEAVISRISEQSLQISDIMHLVG
jgi:hypothetical protein